MNALRRVVQRLLNPFPPFPLIAGQYSSPLEARACAAGHAHVERAFAEPRVRGIVTAFVRFLGDAEAERALKKAYHMAYEQRVRTLAFRLEPAARHGFDPIPPPEGDHPLDRVARAELEGLDARAAALPVSDRGRFAQLAAALAWGFSLVAAASYIALRHGRSRVPPHRVDVLVPESVRDGNLAALVEAAKDAGFDGRMAVLCMHGRVRSAVLPSLEVASLPVPRAQWRRDVVVPAARLAGRVMVAAWRNRGDALALEIATRCLNLACRSLAVRRVGYAIGFRMWLDDAEHDPIHTLKAIIARKTGACAVRFPRTEQDSPGVMMDFMGYDIYPSAGPYQQRTYGATWNPRCRMIPLGLMQHDRRIKRGLRVAPDIERAILERLTRKKMAVFFGPSDVSGLDRPMRELFDATVAALAGRDDWFLVLKPKLTDRFFEQIAADPRYAGWKSRVDLVELRYPQPGVEICPSSWLIERMALGAGWQGTICTETVTQKKPFFHWYPFVEETPYKRILAEMGFLHTSFDGYRRAVRDYVENPDPSRYDFRWFGDSFDPLGDDDALGRLSGILCGDAAARTGTSIRELALERT